FRIRTREDTAPSGATVFALFESRSAYLCARPLSGIADRPRARWTACQ
ncbi:MAG: hypothetical protein ACI9CA_002120, partial [Natronomonas sp.]